jgi:hypothetical protein
MGSNDKISLPNQTEIMSVRVAKSSQLVVSISIEFFLKIC